MLSLQFSVASNIPDALLFWGFDERTKISPARSSVRISWGFWLPVTLVEETNRE